MAAHATTRRLRNHLGEIVRHAWIEWAREQPSPKPSWLVPFEALSDADQEADRLIGEAVARWVAGEFGGSLSDLADGFDFGDEGDE